MSLRCVGSFIVAISYGMGIDDRELFYSDCPWRSIAQLILRNRPSPITFILFILEPVIFTAFRGVGVESIRLTIFLFPILIN